MPSLNGFSWTPPTNKSMSSTLLYKCRKSSADPSRKYRTISSNDFILFKPHICLKWLYGGRPWSRPLWILMAKRSPPNGEPGDRNKCWVICQSRFSYQDIKVLCWLRHLKCFIFQIIFNFIVRMTFYGYHNLRWSGLKLSARWKLCFGPKRRLFFIENVESEILRDIDHS